MLEEKGRGNKKQGGFIEMKQSRREQLFFCEEMMKLFILGERARQDWSLQEGEAPKGKKIFKNGRKESETLMKEKKRLKIWKRAEGLEKRIERKERLNSLERKTEQKGVKNKNDEGDNWDKKNDMKKEDD